MYRPSPLSTVLFLVLLLVVFCLASAQATHQRTLVSTPDLVVLDQAGKMVGATNYLVIQIDRLSDSSGPRVQFDEWSRALGTFRGAAVSQDWKGAALTAIEAAARATGEDPRTWLVTVKNVSTAYMTDGPSASATLAVAIATAVRHTKILPNVALTGGIERDGRITAVGGIPEKIQGAVAAGMTTVLIPKGQSRTRDWDVRPLSENLRITVLEVGTLREAYEKMTGQEF
ncbi:MAG TPA: S16 family serine protease [Nitrospirales bacterium]|jgi:predicted S18 family serine protease|nr:S16 family serine protease [Nitrospirales bacterium]